MADGDSKTKIIPIFSPSPERLEDDDLDVSRTSNAPSIHDLWPEGDIDTDPDVGLHPPPMKQENVAQETNTSLVENYRSDVSSDDDQDDGSKVVDVLSGAQSSSGRTGNNEKASTENTATAGMLLSNVKQEMMQHAGGDEQKSGIDGHAGGTAHDNDDAQDVDVVGGAAEDIEEPVGGAQHAIQLLHDTEPEVPEISCSWFANGTGNAIEPVDAGYDPLTTNLYYPHVETVLDANEPISSNRYIEDAYMNHALEIGNHYMVLTSGLFWDGVLTDVATDINGDDKYTFCFKNRTAKKVTFKRGKVYPKMAEKTFPTLTLDRKAVEVKRINAGALIHKGDIVKLLNGKSGVVYYNNVYTHRLMVFVEKMRYLVCYTQVVGDRRVVENRDWSARRYVESYDLTGPVSFDTPRPVHTTPSKRRRSVCRTVKSSTPRTSTPAAGRRGRKRADTSLAAVVKEEPGEPSAVTPAKKRSVSANTTRSLTNEQLVAVRASITDAVRNVTNELSQTVSAEVGRQVHEALYPVTVAALKLFTSGVTPPSARHGQAENSGRSRTPTATVSFRDASPPSPEAAEQRNEVACSSAQRMSQMSPIPVDIDDDNGFRGVVCRSLAIDLDSCGAGFSPAEVAAQKVAEKLNATHHADDDDLMESDGAVGGDNSNDQYQFVAPLSPSKTPVLRKKMNQSSTSGTSRAVAAARMAVSKLNQPQKQKSPRKSPKKISTAKGVSPNKIASSKSVSPKKISTSKGVSPKKTFPNKDVSSTSSLRQATQKRESPKKTPTKRVKKTNAEKLLGSDRTSDGDGSTTPTREELDFSLDSSSPLNESVTMSAVLSACDIEADTQEEQQRNEAVQADIVTSDNFVRMRDVMVTVGKNGKHTRFDATKIRDALLANKSALIGERESGYFFVTAIRLESGCAVWIAEANKGAMKANVFMKLAGEAAIKSCRSSDFGDRLNAYVTGFTEYLYKDLPQPVYFADTFRDPTTMATTMEEVRMAFKEPFGTAFAEGLKYIMPYAVVVTKRMYDASRLVMKRVVHRQANMKFRAMSKM